MSTQTRKKISSDGFSLAASYFSATEPQGIAIIVGAAGVTQKYYRPFATFLAENHLHALTFDYRGVGDSCPEHLRGFTASMRQWGELDLSAAIEWATQQAPALPLYLVGHSAGGQMIGLAKNAPLARRILLVASQSGYYGHWPRPQRYRWAIFWHFTVPLLTRLLGYTPTRRLRFGDDLPAGIGLEWARWCRHPDFLVDTQGRALTGRFAAIHAPLLAYSFSDDDNAPPAAVEALLKWYTGAPITRRQITPQQLGVQAIGHFGFFRREFRQTLWQSAWKWLMM